MTGNENNPFEDLNEDSIKAMVEAGPILPKMRVVKNATYEVVILSDFWVFHSKEFGRAFAIKVLHENLEKSLVLPQTIRMHFKVYMDINHISYINEDGTFTLKGLIGKRISFQKTDVSNPRFPNQTVYTVQFKE